MFLPKYRVAFAGLFVVCGLGSGVSCSSSDAKKAAMPAGDAGDAGAMSEGGAGHGGAGGSSGAVGVAGEAGSTSEGGSAGELGAAGQGGSAGAPDAEGGAAGASTLSCEPSGNVTNLTLVDGAVYPACRDAIIFPFYDLEASSNDFTCCAVSDTSEPYGLELIGLPDGDGGGEFALHVPAAAPSGLQNLTVTCASGAVTGKISYIVSNTVKAPVLTSASPTIAPSDTMIVTGENLATVIEVTAVAPDGATYACAIDHELTTETSLRCNFDGIPKSADAYRLTLRKDCGYAVATWPFQVVSPPT